MNIVFRTDASITIGTGHVMRCLTLADAFKDGEARCHFICRDHQGNLAGLIKEKGYSCTLLPLPTGFSKSRNSQELAHAEWLGASQEDDAESCKSIIRDLQPSWVIVDHYGINETWEGPIAELGPRIFVIDDLADRDHNCDVLLDQTLGRTVKDYESLVPPRAEVLCGAKYALLRPEFAEWRQFSLKSRKNGELKRIFVNLGGVDKDNLTSSVLAGLEATQLASSVSVIVVLGAQCPNIQSVKETAASSRFSTEVIVAARNMAELMASADLAVGAAGATSWERCCLGLPTLMLVVANNQQSIAANLAGIGAVKLLSRTGLRCEIEDFFKTIGPSDIRKMSKNARSVADGLGSVRVSRKIYLRSFNAY